MAAVMPPLTEAQFMRQVTDLAEMLGWQWAHFRPAMRANGRWYTPVSGPLGKGWPDLVLVRKRDRRLIFAELKRDATYPTPEQRDVMETLKALDTIHPSSTIGVASHVWKPRDFDEIERTLR